MSEFKYEIGDEFLTRGDQVLKVKDRTMSRMGACYWVLNREGSPSTVMESSLDRCTKIEPFFKVGDTFRHPYESGWDRVCEVTHVDEEIKSVWVKVPRRGGGYARESMSEITWRQVMEEVLRNRNA